MLKRLKWLEFTSEHKAKISADLQREFKDGVSYGETKYCDFFMKSQGVLNGKKSVSDWMNRFGEMLKKKYKDNTDALKKTNKKDPGDSEKRSNNNGSFDS